MTENLKWAVPYSKIYYPKSRTFEKHYLPQNKKTLNPNV